MRLSTVASFMLLIVLGCGVYNVANRYEKTERRLASVETKIGGEEEAIRVLQAEWTFLTSPDRLEKISAELLQLQSIDGRQYVALASIPMRADLDAQQMPTDVPGVMPKQAAPQQQIAKAQQRPQPSIDDVVAATLAPALPKPKNRLPELRATPVNATEIAQ